MQRWINTLLLVLSGALTAMAHPPVDTSKWKTHETRLGPHVVRFKYPLERLYTEVPPILEASLDLNDERTWKGRGKDYGPENTIVSARWEYRGWFWQGVLGSLQMYMGIERPPSWFSGNLQDDDALLEMVKERSARGTEAWNQEVLDRAERSAANSIERRTIHEAMKRPGYGFEKVRFAGRTWIRYLGPGNAYQGHPTNVHITALGEDLLLVMSYSLTRNMAKDGDRAWERWAESTGRALAENIVVTTDRP